MDNNVQPFFYLLLHYLGSKHQFKISYEIREKSDLFLQSIAKAACKSRTALLDLTTQKQDKEPQDIYYFKKTLGIVHEVLKDKTADELSCLTVFLEEKIKFLYIDILKSYL